MSSGDERTGDGVLAQMSDAEVEGYLTGLQRRKQALPTAEQEDGGATRGFALLMLIAGILGMYASVSLIRTEKQHLLDPASQLACDINPLIGCGSFLDSPQNQLFFGISNAVYGLAFFAGIVALALVLLSGGRLGRWLWQALCLAMVLAAVWLVWFQYQSFVVERALCPYCLLTWFATIPLIVHTWARSVQAGHVPAPDALRRFLVHGRWYITIGVYLVIVLIAVVRFWEQWAMVF